MANKDKHHIFHPFKNKFLLNGMYEITIDWQIKISAIDFVLIVNSQSMNGYEW